MYPEGYFADSIMEMEMEMESPWNLICFNQVTGKLSTQQHMGTWLTLELEKAKVAKGENMCTTLRMPCPLKSGTMTSAAPTSNWMGLTFT